MAGVEGEEEEARLKPTLGEWVGDPDAAWLLSIGGAEDVEVLRCRVKDGTLRAVRRADDKGLWHLSVTHQYKRRPSRSRYPTWGELDHARNELLPSNVVVALVFPLLDDTLTLHEIRKNHFD